MNSYDSSDKVDQPTHPVIFSKRATSIIADGDEIYPHPGFTETLDYEGEIGVIIGKPGFRISEENAMDHVWGYTIINDMTARERQRDHKQFYIGKSPDTFCPMGPIAVPKEHLPQVLKVQTFVNGEKRQEATTEDLIFSLPFLVRTMSEGQTLQLGDTLATGTPAGVGFGFDPKKWLHPGDEIKVSVTDLGTLTNVIGDPKSTNPIVHQVESRTHVPLANDKTVGGIGLTTFAGKQLFYQKHGREEGQPILFVHCLGGTSEYYSPLLPQLEDTHSLLLFDLEGQGMSPTSARSRLSISSFTSDMSAICQYAGVTTGLTVVAHSMGCLAALQFAINNPDLVKELVLMGPPPSPLAEAGRKAAYERAAAVRAKGMLGVVDTLANAGLSDHSRSTNPMALAACRLSLLGQNSEGYAKACTAMADSADVTLDVSVLKCRTLVITGSDDKVSPPELCRKYKSRIPKCQLIVLENVGHWHLFEDTKRTSAAVIDFCGGS